MKFIFINILFSILFSVNYDISALTDKEKIDIISSELKRAETWYWMARATNNSIEYHGYSKTHYENIKEIALTLPKSLQEPWLSTGNAGAEQAEWRKINAWNNFRNTFPAVWWLIGNDPTLEFKDEDHLMLALSNCWEQLQPGFLGQSFIPPKIFTVPRCNDSKLFEQSTDCGEIKEEFLNTLDQHARFLGVRDDVLSLALGPDWKDFINNKELPIEYGEKIGNLLQTNILLVVDIIPIDEMNEPIDAGRIDMQYYLWNLDDDTLVARGNESGTVITLVPRRWMYSAWILLLIVFVIGYTFVKTKFSKKDDLKIREQTIVGMVCMVLGYILSYYSGQFSNIFVPEFSDMAIDTANYLPAFEMVLWPIIHGALIMIGPLILCAFITTKFQPQIKTLVGNNVDIADVLPCIQAGVLASLFSPIIISWKGNGIELAMVLSICALIMSIAIVPSLEVVLGQSTEEVDKKTPYLSLVLGIIGLFIIIPFGFFQPQFPDDHVLAWLNDMTHWLTGIIIIILAILTWKYRPKSYQIEISVEEDIESGIKGNIRMPVWVLDSSREYESILQEVNKPELYSLLVLGEGGIGKSRFINEIKRNFIKDKWLIGSSNSEKSLNAVSEDKSQNGEPFSIISDAFGPALGIANLAERQSVLESTSKTFSGLESSLAEFPGVGLLFGMTANDAPVVTKDQLIQDVILAVRKKSKENKLVFFLDDIQWIDESSLDLLKKLISYFKQNSDMLTNPVVIVLSSRTRENLQDISSDDYLNKIIELQPFSKDKIGEFLNSAGLSVFPKTFAKEVYDYLGTGNPQHILEFLRGIIASGQAEEDSEGSVTLVPGFNQDDWKSAVPKELNDQINTRLNNLDETELLLLECAAQIGRKFSISALAAGVDINRLQVLNQLRKLEKNTNIVIDIDENDDHYQLESQILRDILKDRLKKKIGIETPELIKEMHYRIANCMIENLRDYSENQILVHCLMTGRRMHKESLEYGEKALDNFSKKFAWTELLNCIELIEKANILEFSNNKLKHKFNYYKALSLRGVGGQENRDNSRKILLSLTSSNDLDIYGVIYSYLETTYEEKQKSELEEMLNVIKDWKNNNTYSIQILNILIDFYFIITDNYLSGNDFDRGKYQNDLSNLNNSLSVLTFNDDRDILKQKSLQSMILQETALDLTRRGKEAKKYLTEINNLFDQSLKLKEECNDLTGIAINYGSRGSFYLYALDDYKNARDYFSKDLDLVIRMGDEGARAGLLNKLAMCDWKESEDIKDDKRSFTLQESAFDLAYQSYRNAMFLKREIDAVFACLNIFNYCNNSIDDHNKIVDSIGKEINDENIWNEITNPYIKTEMLKSVDKLTNKNKMDWIESLKQKLELK